mgnify:FL=1|tara:strand:- start:14674 stop:16575 length:1902 start_codon:yes stop_codon:yes gene_type:complete
MITFISGTERFIEDESLYRKGTIDDVVEYCTEKAILGVDTETEGLDFTCKKMVMFQIGDEDQQFVIDTRFTDISPLRDILESTDTIKIFHNAKFDYKFIKNDIGIECENVYDTMLVEKVLNCGRGGSNSLAALCDRYLNVHLKKDVRNQFINLGGRPFTDRQIVYGAADVKYLCKLVKLQAVRLEESDLGAVADLENEAVLAFSDIEFNGMEVDREAWLKLAVIGEEKISDLSKELDLLVEGDSRLTQFIAKTVQGDLFLEESDLRKVNINWDSPTQVVKVFRKFKTKLKDVNANTIAPYRWDYPLINKYMDYKEQTKLVSSYGKGFFNNASCGDGLIRTQFNQILNTGRVSSREPNMQQIPGDNAYRNCFVPPKGWCFVSSDYSSQELNVIAFGSQDPVWLAALERGEDLHSVCADLVYGQVWADAAEEDCAYMSDKQKCSCPKHKGLRTNVKSINFGLAYGMGVPKLAQQANITLAAAEELIETYFRTFPSIKKFLERLGNFGKRYGYIKTFPPYRRRRWFPKWFQGIQADRSAKGDLGAIERASKNQPIQGASADMTKKAMILIRKYINHNDIPVKMVMTVHDQIDTICKKEYAPEWAYEMTLLMEEAALEIVTNGLLKADTNITSAWEK